MERKVNYELLTREIEEIRHFEREVVVLIMLSAAGIVCKSLTTFLDVL